MRDNRHYDMSVYIYVIRKDGYKSKRYLYWCLECGKNRGYGYKNKIIKTPKCHDCAMSRQDTKLKISINSKKLKHTTDSRIKISLGLFEHHANNKNGVQQRLDKDKYVEFCIQKKIKKNLRSRLYRAIRGNFKSGSAVKDLGCTIGELKVYLESKFQPGMSWGNYGEWHIDHIRPLSSFDLTNKIEFRLACHYSNLQPLWARDNIRKSNK